MGKSGPIERQGRTVERRAMMEPSVHRDPRIINIDDLRPLFGENLPLLRAIAPVYEPAGICLQPSALPTSPLLRYLVQHGPDLVSSSDSHLRSPPKPPSFSVTSVTSPRTKSPFTPCYPAPTYRFTILRPASPSELPIVN